MPDVAQYRIDLEALADTYRNSILTPGDPIVPCEKPIEPHMLLAFMLLYALDKIDEILTKIEDDD